MKNETMKKVITAVSVILTSAIIMLIPQLIHTDFQFAAVDWQTLVVSSLMIDVCVYLGFSQADKNKAEADK